MRIQDYKKATKKLNEFVHKSKMFRDPEYKVMCILINHCNKLLEDAIWGYSMPLYGSDDEPVAFGILPLINKYFTK